MTSRKRSAPNVFFRLLASRVTILIYRQEVAIKAAVIRIEHRQQKEVLDEYEKKLNEFLMTPVDGRSRR